MTTDPSSSFTPSLSTAPTLTPTSDSNSNPNPNSRTSDHILRLTLTPHTSIHVRVQDQKNSVVVFLTSSTHESAGGGGTSALGSFVLGIPNRLDPSQPLSTPLVTVSSSVDFATRAARILAKRLHKPVYVGNSINLAWGPGDVGSPEVGEEIEALRKVVEVVGKATAKDGANGI